MTFEITSAAYSVLQIVEGAAGVAIAALQKTWTSYKNQTVVIVACGANISTDTLTDILVKYRE